MIDKEEYLGAGDTRRKEVLYPGIRVDPEDLLKRASPMDQWLPELIRKFGEEAGISTQSLSNGQVKYRKREAEGIPGVWISKKDAFEAVMSKAYAAASQEISAEPRYDTSLIPAAASA